MVPVSIAYTMVSESPGSVTQQHIFTHCVDIGGCCVLIDHDGIHPYGPIGLPSVYLGLMLQDTLEHTFDLTGTHVIPPAVLLES